MTRRFRAARPALPFIALAVCLPLAACAGTPTTADSPATGDAEGTDTVTVDNCGTEVIVDTPPQRIVTIKSTTLELALALGAGDRVIGSAFTDGPLPAELAEAGADIPVISDKVPSQEAVLALEPDFIFGGWESNFAADGVGERSSLADLGVTSYVAPAACKAPGYMPDPLTFDTVFDSFTEAGQLLGVEEAAEELVAEQQAELAGLEPDARELTTIWYSSGESEPYVGAGIGAPQMIMEHAGLVNAFADVADTWVSTSWEKVASLDPDVLVLVDSPWNTAEAKIAHLESNPATATMRAVTEHRYVILEFAATEAGIRNVESVGSIIEQLGGEGAAW